MMSNYFILLCYLSLVTFSKYSVNPRSNDRYIYVSLENVGYFTTWKKAQHYCNQTFGTDLASFKNDYELNLLLNVIPPCDSGYRGVCPAFIGLRQRLYDQADEWVYDSTGKLRDKGDWIFHDGTNCPSNNYTDNLGQSICVNVSKWARRQPDNWIDVEHCTEISNIDGKLNDIPCDFVYKHHAGFICNKPIDYTPKTTQYSNYETSVISTAATTDYSDIDYLIQQHADNTKYYIMGFGLSMIFNFLFIFCAVYFVRYKRNTYDEPSLSMSNSESISSSGNYSHEPSGKQISDVETDACR